MASVQTIPLQQPSDYTVFSTELDERTKAEIDVASLLTIPSIETKTPKQQRDEAAPRYWNAGTILKEHLDKEITFLRTAAIPAQEKAEQYQKVIHQLQQVKSILEKAADFYGEFKAIADAKQCQAHAQHAESLIAIVEFDCKYCALSIGLQAFHVSARRLHEFNSFVDTSVAEDKNIKKPSLSDMHKFVQQLKDITAETDPAQRRKRAFIFKLQHLKLMNVGKKLPDEVWNLGCKFEEDSKHFLSDDCIARQHLLPCDQQLLEEGILSLAFAIECFVNAQSLYKNVGDARDCNDDLIEGLLKYQRFCEKLDQSYRIKLELKPRLQIKLESEFHSFKVKKSDSRKRVKQESKAEINDKKPQVKKRKLKHEVKLEACNPLDEWSRLKEEFPNILEQLKWQSTESQLIVLRDMERQQLAVKEFQCARFHQTSERARATIVQKLFNVRAQAKTNSLEALLLLEAKLEQLSFLSSPEVLSSTAKLGNGLVKDAHAIFDKMLTPLSELADIKRQLKVFNDMSENERKNHMVKIAKLNNHFQLTDTKIKKERIEIDRRLDMAVCCLRYCTELKENKSFLYRLNQIEIIRKNFGFAFANELIELESYEFNESVDLAAFYASFQKAVPSTEPTKLKYLQELDTESESARLKILKEIAKTDVKNILEALKAERELVNKLVAGAVDPNERWPRTERRAELPIRPMPTPYQKHPFEYKQKSKPNLLTPQPDKSHFEEGDFALLGVEPSKEQVDIAKHLQSLNTDENTRLETLTHPPMARDVPPN